MTPDITVPESVAGAASLRVPAGSTWLPPVEISPAGLTSHQPRVALDPRGGASVVWLVSDAGVDNVRAAFRPAGGSFGGMTSILDASTGEPTPPQVLNLQVARDLRGDALVAWTRSASVHASGRIQTAFIPSGEETAVGEFLSGEGQNAREPQVAFDRKGNALVIWAASEGETNRRVHVAFRPAGGRFGPPQAISDPALAASGLTLAFDPDGNAVVAWTGSDESRALAQAAHRPAGGNFGAAQTLSDPLREAFPPQVAMDSTGETIAVWRDSDSTNVQVQIAVRPAGGIFGPPRAILTSNLSIFSPQVRFVAPGHAVATWFRDTPPPDGNVVEATFRPPGEGFGPPQPVSVGGVNTALGLAADAHGTAISVWLQVNSQNSVLAAIRPVGRRSDRFQRPETISDPAGDVPDDPQVAIDAQGNPLVIWTHQDGGESRIQAAERAVAQTISGPEVSALESQLAVDRGGNLTATWVSFGDGKFGVQAAFCTRERFGPPQIVAPAGADVRGITLAVDDQGNAIALWERLEGVSRRIQTAFSPPGGSFGAPLNISPAGQNATEPRVGFDAQGTAIAIWERSGSTNRGIQAALRPAGGNFGPAQTISAQDAALGQLSVNDRGDALAVWVSSDGVNSIVQASIRTAGGSFGPPQNIFTATLQDPANPITPRVALDALGNGLVVWSSRDGTTRHVQAAFRPAGGSFGPAATIAVASKIELPPRLAMDAHGNALVIWVRSGDTASSSLQAAFRPVGGSFGPPQTVSPAGEITALAAMAFDPKGNALVLWPTFSADGVRAAFRPLGGTFGTAQAISGAAFNNSGLQVAFDSRGNALAMWTDRHHGSQFESGTVQAAFRPAGGSFDPAQTLSDPDEDTAFVRLVFDSLDNAIALWSHKEGGLHGNSRLRATFRPPGGHFGPL